MEIQYLSNAEAAMFGAMIHSGSELADLFGSLVLMLEADTDYDTILISFEDDNVMRISIEDSPYILVLDEQNQVIDLLHGEKSIHEDDFTEDGLEEAVDIMASRILGSEHNAR